MNLLAASPRPRLLLAASAAMALLLAGSSLAAPLIERLPASAAMFGAIDFAALRKSPLGGAATSAASFNEEAGKAAIFLAKAGIDPGRDLSELAFAILPQQGGAPDELAILASGNFNAAKIRAAAVSEGGKEAKIGGISALRMPKSDGDKDAPMFLSFLGDVAVMASEQATKVVHGKDSSVAPARRPADIPAGSAFWFAGDLGRIDAARSATSSVPAASKIQRVLFWGFLTEAVELHAIADATEAAAATQVAGLAQMAAGFAAMSQDAEATALLSALKVSAQDRRITASLTLTPAQIAQLNASASPAEAAADAKPPTQNPAITPAK